MNELKSVNYSGPFGEEQVVCAMLTIDNLHSPFVLHNISEVNKEYTFSLYIRSDAEGSITVGGETIETTTEWANHAVTFIADSIDVSIFFNVIGTYYLYNTQLEIGNRNTDWRPAVEDIDLNISAAGKTATNYLEFSNGGLIIGDHTAGTLIKNVLINSDSVDIRNGDTVLARYADKEIHLGMDSVDSIIYLCGDTGYISAMDNDELYDTLQIVTPGHLSLRSDDTISLSISNSYGYSSLYTICNANNASLEISVSTNSGNTFIEALPTQIRLQSVASGGVADLFIDPIKREVRVDNGTFYVKNGSGVFDKGIAVTGMISTTGEIISTNPTGFRIAYGNYGSFIRNDGDSTYFLLTNSGDIYGNWNNLRPLAIKNSTGNVTIGHDLNVGGSISEGGTALIDKYVQFIKDGDHPRIWVNTPYHWIRTPESGLLPYSTDNMYGYSSIGSSGWPFKTMYGIQYFAESAVNSEVGFYSWNTAHKGCFVSTSGGSLGIYSSTHGGWVIYGDTGGSVYLGDKMVVPVSGGAGIRPNGDNVYGAGNGSNRFTKVFAVNGVDTSSDEREKDIITDMHLEDYSDLFMDVKPIMYRWKSGDDKQIHFGVGAQTLERQFKEYGYDPSQYAIITHCELEEPTPTGQTDRYGMNYQDLQMLTLMQTQKNTRDLELAVNRIKELEKKIMKLEQGIG